jgi:predicted DNA-binding WGR domain protein
MPRYEFSEGTSNKFWQIDLSGSSFTTTFGRIGSAGQSATKSFDSDAKALSEYNKLIGEKTKKGYQLVAAVTTSAAATPRNAPSAPAPARAAAPTPRTAPPAPAPAAAPPKAAGPPPAPASTPVPVAARSGASTAALAMTDAARRAAKKEREALEIKPCKADNPIGRWLTDVYRPFVERSKAAVQNGTSCGDGENQRLCRAVLKEYGSLERMPAQLDLDTAAAALLLVPGGRDTVASTTELVAFWVAHSGLPLALDAFSRSVSGYHRVDDGSGKVRWLTAQASRVLDSLFASRADLAIQACWRGAADEERLAAHAHGEKLRAAGTLLERSALASAVLDPAWIDADLREHATTGARAMLSPEALLLASSAADIAAYVGHLTDGDLGFYPPYSPYLYGRGNAVIAGFAYAERLGLGGIDIACARIERLLPHFTGDPYVSNQIGGQIRVLLEVARLGKHYAPTVKIALAVIERCETYKLAKDSDPGPLAYDCLRGSPELALPLVATNRRGWAKDILPQLERLTGSGAAASDDRPDADASALPEALRRAPVKFTGPEFWQPAALPRIALRDGTRYPSALLDALASALKAGNSEAIAELAQIAERASLAAFAWDLFQAWLTSGAPAKDKWAFTALGALGNDETARRLTPLIRAWPGESQHQRAVGGLDVLGAIGSDVALMMLNGIAQKVKFKGLQERAREKMDEIAAKRGITADQLADRLVPDLDLEDDGSKTLDFGPRSFRVGFDEMLAPYVVDASGTRLKELPKPNSKDDPALGAEASETWKAMKKDARALAGIQLMRLELAMGNARRWSGEEFRNFFVEHPLLTHLVRRLVWGVYESDEHGALKRTFRVAEDRSYADMRDEACSVDSDATIGIVHRLHLPDSDAAAWGKLFGDYELAQPFEQLARTTYRLVPEERMSSGLGRFVDCEIETKKLLGLLSRGWRKGPALDNGIISEFYKPIRADLIAALPFHDGIIAGGMDYTDPSQTLGLVDFAPSEPSWGSRTGVIVLGEIDEVIVSEVIRDLESLKGAAK